MDLRDDMRFLKILKVVPFLFAYRKTLTALDIFLSTMAD